MAETVVTRGGQITLTKDVRERTDIKEGDVVMVNTIGNTILVSKRDPAVFDKGNFLPENFGKVLREMRKFSYFDRLKKLGVAT